MIPIYWLSFHEEIDNRGYWDQAFLEALFEGRFGAVGYTFEHRAVRDELEVLPDNFAIVVLPARHHAADVERLNSLLTQFNSAVLILTGDEEHVFPIHEVRHPDLRFWIMSPRGEPWDYPVDSVFLLSGWQPLTTYISFDQAERDLDWFFSGQINTPHREEWAAMLRELPGGELHETEGFTQGLEGFSYLYNLSRAKYAPCPGGPFTDDTFRISEALEMGSIPLVPPSAMFSMVFQHGAALPVLPCKPDSVPGLMPGLLQDYDLRAAQVFGSWQLYKRWLRLKLRDHIYKLSGVEPQGERITYLIPTSPIASHPSIEIITETIVSIRERDPHGDIFVMFDGVRPEQEHLREAYAEYRSRLLHLFNHSWGGVYPIVAATHVHQSGLVRRTLPHVGTSVICFVEHDTPLTGEIPLYECANVVRSGMLNVLRFHHEATIPWEHDHLMLDPGPIDILGVPVRRTAQWSQRPHLASTSFYHWLMDTYFGTHSAAMIEDTVYGAAEMGKLSPEAWAVWRLGIYAPEGSYVRSRHTDGRGAEKKYAMHFDYRDNDNPPPGAPHPGVREM